jgi:GTPase
MNDWAQICEKSVKIINFFDMGGSEKSLKNTVKTLSKNYLDYIFFFISADKGISNMTSDYLKIALSLGLPIVTIITKVDLINEDDLADLLNNFKCILKAQKKGKNPLLVQDKNDIVTFSRNITEGILPVFLISNKKGIGLDLFINFLNLMPDSTSQNNFENLSLNEKETLFDVLEIIIVENKLILLGIVTKGVIVKDCVYKLGPDSNGNFKTVQVKSIHCKKVDVKSAFQGQFCSVCLDESLTKDSVRTGMVILSSSSTSAACRRFEAEIWSIAGQGKKIKLSAQPLIHVPPIRQTVKIFKDQSWENSSSEDLEVFEDKTIKIFFEFMYAPEYIREGSHLIIYENNFKIYGYVTKIIN